MALPPSFHHVRVACDSDAWRHLAITVFTAKVPLDAPPCAYLHNLATFSACFPSNLKWRQKIRNVCLLPHGTKK
jgi:hypothetical protein